MTRFVRANIGGALKVLGVAPRDFAALEQVNGEHGQKVKAREERATRTKRLLARPVAHTRETPHKRRFCVTNSH
jgi:hypothetical protein